MFIKEKHLSQINIQILHLNPSHNRHSKKCIQPITETSSTTSEPITETSLQTIS